MEITQTQMTPKDCEHGWEAHLIFVAGVGLIALDLLAFMPAFIPNGPHTWHDILVFGLPIVLGLCLMASEYVSPHPWEYLDPPEYHYRICTKCGAAEAYHNRTPFQELLKTMEDASTQRKKKEEGSGRLEALQYLKKKHDGERADSSHNLTRGGE